VTAIIREIPDSKSAEKKNRQLLEIWKDNYLHSSVDLQVFDKHGKVYTDGNRLIFALSLLYQPINSNFLLYKVLLVVWSSPLMKSIWYIWLRRKNLKSNLFFSLEWQLQLKAQKWYQRY
jgi:hypothetical protein